MVENNKIKEIDIIIHNVCQYRGITKNMMMEKIRKREIVQSRQEAMVLSLKYTNLSTLKIGSYIGGKDHSTVLHAKKTINNLLETDKVFSIEHDEIKTKIESDLKTIKNIKDYTALKKEFIKEKAYKIWHETNIDLNIDEISILIEKLLNDYDVYKSEIKL